MNKIKEFNEKIKDNDEGRDKKNIVGERKGEKKKEKKTKERKKERSEQRHTIDTSKMADTRSEAVLMFYIYIYISIKKKIKKI